MNSVPKTIEAADISQILRLLPHRYPFLMIDRIVDIQLDKSCTGIKNVSINEPHFQGHFPDSPIMPGVLQIEGMAQTAGALVVLSKGYQEPPSVYFMSIEKTRFRKPVVPGDQIRYEVTKLRERGSIFKYDCVAYVDGERVSEAELTAMVNQSLPE
jgi:3-hydroxyacyl-[acyl-carrier-protein] dehydratase